MSTPTRTSTGIQVRIFAAVVALAAGAAAAIVAILLIHTVLT